MRDLIEKTYGDLAPIDQVKSSIAEIVDLAAADDVHEKIKAAGQYDNKTKERSDYWAELAIWSARRLGELIREMPKKRDRHSTCSTLAQVLGMEDQAARHKSSRCQELARMEKADIETAIAEIKESGNDVTRASIKAKVKASESLVKSKPKRIRKESLGIHHCSFRELEVADESVDLVFVDPPYDRHWLPNYGDMLTMAKRVLVPGGSVVTYCGHLFVPDVVQFGRDAGLRFFWLCACLHRKKALMTRSGIRNGYKPLVWFTKGDRYDVQSILQDCVLDPPEKTDHKWQQSEAEAARYIEALSRRRAVVFDPCCGSGTTAAAAKKLGRKWITCDVDSDSIQVARERIDAID